jgi:hypothetical protein
MSDEEPPEKAETAGWSRVLAATGSPLKLFALIVLVCNTVFGVAASWSGELEAFTYSIHMFLAIVASFVLIALWSPRSLYHPKELLELRELENGFDEDEKLMPPDRPWVATAVLVAGVIFYGLYQLIAGGYITFGS